jgi:hypothetical protein
MSTPVELDRAEARDLAVRELADPRYDVEAPLLQRVLEWLLERFAELLARAAGALDSTVGVILLTFVVVLIALILIAYGSPARRAASGGDPVFGSGRRSARSHRAAADAAVDAERWAAAVVERFRAVVATLEERAVIDPQPGRTADEAARDAGVALPDLADQLRAAATLFDRVHYGGEQATAADHNRLHRLDDAVRTARPRPQEAHEAVPG